MTLKRFRYEGPGGMTRKETGLNFLIGAPGDVPIFNPPEEGRMVEDPNGEYVLASDASSNLADQSSEFSELLARARALSQEH